MIDIKTQKLIPLAAVADLPWLPARKNGGRLSPSTVWRWAKFGRRGIKLESIQARGILCTTSEAVFEFFERISMPGVKAEIPTPSEQAKAQANAKSILAKFGIV